MRNYLVKAKELVSQMTLDEKVHLCTGNSYWTTYPIERLNLPECVLSDGPHGIRKVTGKDHLGQSISEKATGFPTSSAMGSTWNKQLMYDIGEALGIECQSIGVDILLGPAINMKRSVLGGRNFEYFSEDPILCGQLAAEMVKGIQDQGVGACVKHYACNNSEFMRMTIDCIVDKRTLHEIYLKAFEIIVKTSNPVSIMGSYNKVNGTYACENTELLTDILRDQWGFEGIVLSDWLAVNDIAKSIDAGLNLEMPGNKNIIETLKASFTNGSLKKLDERVTEMVCVILKLQDSRKRNTKIDWEKHDELSVRVACESAVLLKNNASTLPISCEKTKKIAVLGEFAKFPRSQGGGSSKVLSSDDKNAFNELVKLADGKTEFLYSAGYNSEGDTTDELIKDALNTAKDCDKIIIFAGLPESYESEGYDRTSIAMPDGHNKLIREVSKKYKNTIVVLNNGSAISLTFASQVDAIIETWLGGGGGSRAIAKILLGFDEPSGRLAETFPFRIEDDAASINFPGEEGIQIYGERMFVGYRHFEKINIAPAYPFGYGLSYSNFDYSDITLDKNVMNDTDSVEVSFTLTNTGNLTATEVVQLYVSNKQTTLIHPIKELKQFDKITLKKGESKKIAWKLTKDDFSCYNSTYSQWTVESGSYEVLIGSSSKDICLSKAITLKSTDVFIVPLTKTSTLMEWLSHPKGKALAEKMLENYKGFGMAMTGKTFSQLSLFVQRIMLEMPMPRLITASNNSFTHEQLDTMLNSTKKK